jgi:hypothetical protein
VWLVVLWCKRVCLVDIGPITERYLDAMIHAERLEDDFDWMKRIGEDSGYIKEENFKSMSRWG